MKNNIPIHQGHRERLRMRYEREGLKHFQPHEVLELVLTYSIPRINVNPIAHRLIKNFGSIHRVFDASIEELCFVEGVGKRTAVLIHLFKDVMRVYELSKFGSRANLSNKDDCFEYCKHLLKARDYETIFIINLDSQKRLISTVELQEGTITEVQLYVRKVIEVAMLAKAHSIILTHNHPNGSTIPSNDDIRTTLRIIDALKTVDIKLVDHIIVADNQCISMREKGFLNRNIISF
jgi:DNA repair protein RadC